MAHALVPVCNINLHDRYFNGECRARGKQNGADLSPSFISSVLDASDPSGPRLLQAARTLLSQVYLLVSTGYPLVLLHPFMVRPVVRR